MSHLAATLAALRERFGSDLEVVEFRGETTVVVPRAVLLDVLRLLRESPALNYRMLSHITAYDDWPAEPRFNVVYLVRELEHVTSLRLKVRLAGDDAVLPSATGLYPNAGWAERELYDMFGVRFTDHPDLRRILMPSDWEGHPLRKDYPLGYEEVQFTFNFDEIEKKKPYAQD